MLINQTVRSGQIKATIINYQIMKVWFPIWSIFNDEYGVIITIPELPCPD